MQAQLVIYCLIGFAALVAAAADDAPAPRSLAFRIDEGRNINSFLRDGPVAAHLLLRSGTEPRILVAFPAGNSGVGLWFEKTTQPVGWTLVSPPRPITVLDEKKRPLHGIEFEVTTDAAGLRPRAAVLSSVRVLRDFEIQRTAPAEVMTGSRAMAGGIAWARDRLDGEPGYRLTIAGAHASNRDAPLDVERQAECLRRLRLAKQQATPAPDASHCLSVVRRPGR